ncbi:MAG: hypothetical protein HYY49_04180 [Ignavibacteriales bacterium]|nr:hypothetical protein [Ignavibacteriales bacterium]
MRRILVFLFFCMAAFPISPSSLITQAQGSPEQETQATSQTKEQYACPMHPDVTSDKPGSCSKCGMALVRSTPQEKDSVQTKLTPPERIRAAKRMLQAAKSELTRQGKYNCCIEEPCSQCALDHQSCPCYDDLKKGKPVCPECYGGWQRGEGRDKKVKKSDVKTQFSSHKH